MAFLLQVWVIVQLGRGGAGLGAALCFGKLRQIHLAIGIPFPVGCSGYLGPITVQGLIALATLNSQGRR